MLLGQGQGLIQNLQLFTTSHLYVRILFYSLPSFSYIFNCSLPTIYKHLFISSGLDSINKNNLYCSCVPIFLCSFFISKLLKIIIFMLSNYKSSPILSQNHTSVSDPQHPTKINLSELITLFILMHFLYLASRTTTTKNIGLPPISM